MFHQPHPLQPVGSAKTPATSTTRRHGIQRSTERRVGALSIHRRLSILVFLLLASIDNTVLAMIPTALPLIGADLGGGEAALGIAIGLQLLVMALTAVVWGYLSDRSDRRTLLMIGTFAWVVPMMLLTRSTIYSQFVVLIALAGVGLGCVMTAGYSIMSDLVGPRQSGLLLSLWGGLQSIGAGMGPVLIGLLVPTYGWRVPFGLVASVGAALAALALFAVAPPKGGADPDLRRLHQHGAAYTYQISRTDLPMLLRRPSNRCLMLQGLIGQLAYGALQWLPALLTAKLMAQGLPLTTAAGIGALLFPITQIGGVFGILGGYLGDLLQRRHLRSRAVVAGIGLWLSVPAYLVFFWLPLPITQVTTQPSPWQIVIGELAHNPYLWLTLVSALVATATNAVNAPNWYALVRDVNLPEHRGTAFSLIALASSMGRAIGSAAAGAALAFLSESVWGAAGSSAYPLALTMFVLCFMPAGWCFFRAAASVPRDILAIRTTLARRAAVEQDDRQ